MRVTDVSINGTDRYSTVYNAKGQIAEIKDLVNNEKTVYTYDISGRLLKISQSGGKSISTGYDILNRVTAINYQFAGETKTVSFGYGQDGQKGESTLLSGATQTVEYDTLGREESSTVGSLTRDISYLNVSGNRTTTLPQTLTYTQNDATLLSTSYTYDVRGNIATMTIDGVIYTYTYDSLNQLTAVETSDNSFTATYSYDNGGNITSKEVNGATTPYGYTDANWKDKLTSYNGQSISYDAMGNPLESYMGRFYWTGRQLTMVETLDGTLTGYTYNDSGIRTKKSVGSVTTEYFLQGSTILAEKTGNNVIWYIYDTGGELLGFTYNGTPYYYLKNQQGDVYKIVDANGTVVGSYTYDPWGKVLTATGTMAQINPIRYRSYYYDSETGFYYLQSRYYDPEIGRFINADVFVATGQGFVGNNMFAYCLNNPIAGCDPCGTCYHRLDFWNDCEKCGGETLKTKAENVYNKCVNTITNFVEYVSNDDETIAEQNLIDDGVTFYKGALIISVDWMGYSAASFGVIFMGSENLNAPDFADSLNHEYGHFIHFMQIGPVDYLKTTAIPSLIGAALPDNGHYYDYPWERVADYLGGVDRGYSPFSNTAGSIHWIFSILYSFCTVY